jgi:outer membrane biosynthesis protein TonB
LSTELPAYAQGTYAVAEQLAELSDAGCITVIGGGDSVAAVNKAGPASRTIPSPTSTPSPTPTSPQAQAQPAPKPKPNLPQAQLPPTPTPTPTPTSPKTQAQPPPKPKPPLPSLPFPRRA